MPAPVVHDGKVIRQSLLNDADICLRRLQYNIGPDSRRTTSTSSAIGTAYHYAMELYYNDRKVLGYYEPPAGVVASYIEAALDLFDDIVDGVNGEEYIPDPVKHDQAKAIIGLMVSEYFANKYYWPDGYTVIDTEFTFRLPPLDGTGSWERAGTIDLILLDPNSWYIAVDHKTAGRKWQKNKHLPRKLPQGGFYVDVLCELYGTEQVTFVYDIITHKGEFERRGAHRTTVDREKVRQKIQLVTQMGDLALRGMEMPPNTASDLCKRDFCSYWEVCPFGAAWN